MDDGVPAFGGHSGKGGVAANARVLHDSPKRAVGFCPGVKLGLAVGAVAKVELNQFAGTARRLYLLKDSLGLFFSVIVVGDDIIAFLGGGKRDRRADSARGSGHQNFLSNVLFAHKNSYLNIVPD